MMNKMKNNIKKATLYVAFYVFGVGTAFAATRNTNAIDNEAIVAEVEDKEKDVVKTTSKEVVDDVVQETAEETTENNNVATVEPRQVDNVAAPAPVYTGNAGNNNSGYNPENFNPVEPVIPQEDEDDFIVPPTDEENQDNQVEKPETPDTGDTETEEPSEPVKPEEPENPTTPEEGEGQDNQEEPTIVETWVTEDVIRDGDMVHVTTIKWARFSDASVKMLYKASSTFPWEEWEQGHPENEETETPVKPEVEEEVSEPTEEEIPVEEPEVEEETTPETEEVVNDTTTDVEAEVVIEETTETPVEEVVVETTEG